MIIMNLKNHESAQCHVEIDTKTKEIRFVSYKTTVIVATFHEGHYLLQGLDASEFNQKESSNDTPYSNTTGRQIGWFLSEYFPDVSYADIKSSAKNGELYSSIYSSRIAKDWVV